jgi:hypothetical protein
MVEYALVVRSNEEPHTDQVLMLVETRQCREEIAVEMRDHGRRVTVVALAPRDERRSQRRLA